MISDGDEPPYTNDYRVSFEIYTGTARKGRLNVDLVVSFGLTGEIVVAGDHLLSISPDRCFCLDDRNTRHGDP